MITIHTATYDNAPLARLWHAAVKATLRDPHRTVVYHAHAAPGCADEERSWADAGIPSNARPAGYAVLKAMPQDGVRLFIEEDMIPLRPWSVDDYPGNPGILEGAGRPPWYAFTVYRSGRAMGRARGYTSVAHRYCREYMPDWVPAELRQPALDADSLIVGDHFLHVDRVGNVWPRSPAKEALLDALAAWWGLPPFEHRDRPVPTGLAIAMPKPAASGKCGHLGPRVNVAGSVRDWRACAAGIDQGVGPGVVCSCNGCGVKCPSYRSGGDS